MKQITPEIKQRIAALYYGQNIMQTTINRDENNLSAIMQVDTAAFIDADSKYFLNVFDLSSITDEDVRIIDDPRWFTKQNVVTELSRFGGNCWNVFIDQLSPLSYDMLRSKGYALPAFGYSVDELVEAGVFKLKEVNNDN